MGNLLAAALRNRFQPKPKQENKPKKKGIKLRIVRNGRDIYWVEEYVADTGFWDKLPGSMALSEDKAAKFIENYIKNKERHVVRELEI